jgi:hypothetical protein
MSSPLLFSSAVGLLNSLTNGVARQSIRNLTTLQARELLQVFSRNVPRGTAGNLIDDDAVVFATFTNVVKGEDEKHEYFNEKLPLTVDSVDNFKVLYADGKNDPKNGLFAATCTWNTKDGEKIDGRLTALVENGHVMHLHSSQNPDRKTAGSPQNDGDADRQKWQKVWENATSSQRGR